MSQFAKKQFLYWLRMSVMEEFFNLEASSGMLKFTALSLRPKDTCIHLDAVEEHDTNVTSLPASYRMMSG